MNTASHSPARVLRASAIGNFMEWFDFALYGFFAPAIGANFFPSDDPLLSTLASYTAFAAGFVARPIGAWCFGRMADRRGRQPVLVITLLLMGLSCGLVVAAPPHHVAGIVGTLMVVTGRLLAGLAVAGETGAAAAMAIEAAPHDRRGRWGGLFMGSTYLGVAAGGFVVVACHALLGAEVVNDWGWRCGYAVGLLIIPVGYWARRRLGGAAPVAAPPADTEGIGTAGMIVRVAGLTAFGSALFYIVIVFMPVYGARQLGIPLATGMGIALAGSLLTALLAVVGGRASDVWGRKRVMSAAALAAAIAAWPLFALLLHAPSVPVLALFQCVSAAALGVMVGSGLPLIVENFPPARRALGVGLGYSIGVMLFGALAPAVNTLALHRGMAWAPLGYLTVAALVTLLALWSTPERALPRGSHRSGAPSVP